MRASKDVKFFGTNRIDTVSIIKAKVIIKEIIDGAERQVFKIVILFISGSGKGR
jgi:hypothetical protein